MAAPQPVRTGRPVKAPAWIFGGKRPQRLRVKPVVRVRPVFGFYDRRLPMLPVAAWLRRQG